MSKLSASWNVAPHGLLTRVTENLYTVNARGRLPFGEATSRMTVVRLEGGRVLVHGPMALREEEMDKLVCLGRPAFLVVLTAAHQASALAWQERYPDIAVIASPRLAHELDARLNLRHHHTDLGDSRVSVEVVAGTGESELALVVESNHGKALVLNELVFNLPRARGLRGMLMPWLGYGPGVTMPKFVSMKLVRDKALVGVQLGAWAQLGGLKYLVMSHGEVIENPRAVLLQLATSLSESSARQRAGHMLGVGFGGPSLRR